jgi:hypothetical protein
MIGAPAPLAVGTKELIEGARGLDGSLVVFEGEAIGDPMRRGDHVWVNLLDKDAAMGIYLPLSDLALIRSYGSYRSTGDILRVSGVFNRACPEHGGDMDIHASSVLVVTRGRPSPRPVDRAMLVATPLALLLAGLLFLIWRRQGRSQEGR